ncbi:MULTISPECIES: O-antigen ligase family protein [unclassified Curtobacterium]|uniref:O-antigen ligase family protein n=1 Tax=unclassified Curtobacterium TaxID=257496 RepID=UPI00082494AC|nr:MULTISPECIES: O-antigen ligase family protein [unclassified Curtobacterium]WIA99003.1 O-antigen ligase family protein [Curtobacterium sp. MCBA15_012]
MTNTWPIARGTVSEREAFALAVAVVGTLFAGDAVPNVLTWYGAAAVWALEAAWGVSVVVRARPPIARTPRSLWFFLAWCLVTVAWSHWRPATLASMVAQVVCVVVAFAIASTLSWRRLLDAVSVAMRWVLGLSLVFEAVVAVVVRHPIAPIWTDYGDRKIPDAFYFSRAELLTGGRIQGLPGNANLLAMVALLAAVAVAVQLAEGRIGRSRGLVWLALAVVVLGLTRSSTVLVAAVAVVLAALVAVWLRRVPTERRTPRYLLLAVVAVVVVAGGVAARSALTGLLGKTSDLTGRGEIWDAVLGLVARHPVVGSGWIGYWWPNIPELADIAHRNGVTYLQAHDAYLDVWMQTGVVGLVLFVAYVLTTLLRSWSSATRVAFGPDLRPRPFDPVSLFPLLVVVALLVQSVAESRLLYQGNWVLFAVLAVKTRNVLVGEEPASVGDGPRTPRAARAFRQAGAR